MKSNFRNQPQNTKYFPRSHSLLETYLATGRAIHRCDNLSSRDHYREKENLNKQSKPFKPDYASFSFNVPGTTLQFDRKIEILEDLDKQDIKSWGETFLETTRLCNWDEKTSSNALKALLHPKFVPHIRNQTRVVEMLDLLFEMRYPARDSIKYYQEIGRLHQGRFYLLSEFYNELRTIIIKLGYTLKWTQREIELKLEESFIAGLGRKTAIEVVRLNLSNATEILERLNPMEERILKEVSNHLTRQPTDNKATNKKWCYYHKTNKHDKTECFVLKRKNGNSYTMERNQNLGAYIKEPNPQQRLLKLKAKAKNRVLTCLLDTGSQMNYISNSLVSDLNLRTSAIPTITAELANGSKQDISQKTEISLTLDELPHTTFALQARILENAAYPIILGLHFIEENKVVIDYEKTRLKIAGFEIEMDFDEAWKVNPDSKIVEKVNLTDCQSRSSIEDIVKQAQKENPEIGQIDTFEHSIILRQICPINCRSYPIPFKLQPAVSTELVRLQKNNIIGPSSSNFVSPAFPVLKRDGSIRLVVDFRKLNAVTEKASYPLPDIRSSLAELKGKTVFTTLDLNMGYYQIPMSKDSIKYTSFIIGREQFEFYRMPFGLTNAPRTFQRAINFIVKDLSNVRVYLDDILIASETYQNHQKDLKLVLKRLKQSNASINFKKSKFAVPEVTYLGNVISSKGIGPDLSRIQNCQIKPPTNKRELMRTLGLLNWFRPYIKDASQLLLPLTEKLKSMNSFTWRTQDSETLKQIVERIKENTILAHPDFSLPFKIQADASEQAVGSVLTQQNSIIGFHSCKFSTSQRRYSIVEKELYGILEALRFFRNIIFGSVIEIETDNKNLVYEKLMDDCNRIQRWKILLSEYNITLKHISGKQNLAADYLSRSLAIQEIYQNPPFNL